MIPMPEEELETEDQDQRIPVKEWLFDPRARLGRASYNLFVLPPLVAWLGLQADGTVGGLLRTLFFLVAKGPMLLPGQALWDIKTGSAGAGLVGMLLVPLLLYANMRRLRDLGWSPFWTLFTLVPFAGIPTTLVTFLLTPGEAVRNASGYPERLGRRLPCEDEEREALFRQL